MFNGVNNPFQRPASQCGEYTYQKTDEQHEAFVTNLFPMASTPAK
jgi:hypothetical protein